MRNLRAALAAALALAFPASATVTGNPPPAAYSCNGTTTTYTIPFPYLATSQVVATVTTGAVVSTLALTTDYTVTPSVAPSVGTLKLTAGSKCPNGSTLTITRNVPLTQPQSFRLGPYSGAAHEQAYDRLLMQLQQLNTKEIADLGVVNNTVAAFNASGAAIGSTTSVLSTGSTTPRTLAARFADFANVKDYGAKGDGSTDDTAAIQAAINSVATNGGTVRFPPGTYVVSRASTNQWALTNTGAPSLRLVGEAGAKITMAADISTTQIALGYFFGVQKMEVTGLDISVTVTGNPGTRVNAYIFNFSPNGATPCKDVSVHNNNFKITHALGSTEIRALFVTYFYGGEVNGPTWAQSRLDFSDNHVTDSEGRGVETWNVEKVTISRNRFANMAPIRSATVIRMIGAVREVQVSDNYIELAASANSASSYGIVWGSGSTTEVTWTPTKSDIGTFVNNTIISKGGDVANNQIGVYCQGGQRASFVGNTLIQNNNTAFSGAGFRFDADPNAGSCVDIALIGNRIAGWNTWGVFENDAGSARIQLTHNIFGGPSAAALAGLDKDWSDANSTLDLSQANWSSLSAAWVYGGAKSRRLAGTASPQNSVIGSPGDIFNDTTNGDIYWKGSGSATNNGWLKQASAVASGSTVTAGGTISVTRDATIVYTVNAAGAVTASNTTAIANGSFIGQTLVLSGTSDTNTVTIPNLANTRLSGSASITLGSFDAVTLFWNGSAWVETSRTMRSGVQALTAGAATVAVMPSCRPFCTDTTAANAVKCSVSGSTLTIAGTGTDSIDWTCR